MCAKKSINDVWLYRFSTQDPAKVTKNPDTLYFRVTPDSEVLQFCNQGLLGDKEIILASISWALSETDISLTDYYHFTRKNVDYVLASLKKDI